MERGDYHVADTLHMESLEIKRSMGDKPGIIMSLNNLGVVALEKKDFDAARVRFNESLALAQEIGDNHMIVYDLVGLAGVAARIGLPDITPQQAERSVHLAAAADKILTSIGATMEPAIRRQYDKTLEKVRAVLSEQEFNLAWDAGKFMPVDEVLAE